MNDDLKILISVGLKSTTVTDINKELEKLSKDPALQKLNVKINIDESFTKTINNFIDVTKRLDQALQQQNQVVNETVTTYKKLDGSIEKVREKHLANGSIITQTNKKIDEHNQKLNQETKAYDEQRKTIQQLEKELIGFNKINSQVKKNGTGEITGYRNTYQYKTGQKITANVDAEGYVNRYTQTTDYAKQIKEIEQIENARIKSEIRVRDEKRKADESQQKAIQKNMDADREAHNKRLSQLQEFQRKSEETYSRIGKQKLSIENAQRLDSTIAQVRSLDVNDASLPDKMKRISSGFKDISASAKEGSIGLKSFVDSAGKLAAHVPVFMAVHTAIYGVFNAISEGFRGMIDIEAKMAGYIQTNEKYFESLSGHGLDQKKINDQTQRFIITAHELGAEIGEVTESARLWGRMYKDVGVVQELVRQSTMLSTVDLVSLEDATKSMESVLAQYGVQLKNTADAQLYGNRILDSWSKVAHDTMAPAKDLGAAFERTGKIAAETGVSFDFMNGLVSAGIRNTALSGENLGNMWKTVLGTIRTGKAVDEIEKLGVATKEVVNGTEQWRKAEDIILDLSVAVIDKNYDLTQSYADISRGVYQYAKLAASLQAGDILLGTSASINSTGSTVEYLTTQMDTILRKSSQVKTSFLEIFNTAGNDGLRSSLKGILDVIDQLLIGITKVPPGLIEFGAVFTAITASAALAKQPILNLVQAIGVLKTAKAASTAATIADTAANTANIISSDGQVLSTVAKTTATTTSTTAIGAQTVATSAATVATEGLAAAEATATVTMAAMTGGLTLLAALFVGVAVSAGKAEKQHRDNVQAIKDEIAANNQLISQQQRQAEFLPKAVEAYQKLNELSKKDALNSIQQANVKKQLAEIEEAIVQTVGKEGFERLKTGNMSQQALQTEIDLLGEKTKAQREANKEQIQQLQSEGKDKISAKYDEILKKEKEIANYRKNHPYQVEGVQFNNLQAGLDKLKDEYADLENQQQGYNDQLLQLNADQVDQLTGSMGKLTEETGTAADALKQLFDNLDGYADDVKTLNQTIDKLNKGQSLNSDEVFDLIKKYPELAGHVKQTTEGWKLELKAVENLRAGKINLATKDIETEKNKSLNTLNESLKRIKQYGLELAAINNVQDAKDELNRLSQMQSPMLKSDSIFGGAANIKGLVPDLSFKGLSDDYGNPFAAWDNQIQQRIPEAISAYKQYIDTQEQLEKQSQDMLNALSDPSFGVDKTTEKQKDLNDTYSETNEVLTETLKRLRDLKTAQDEIQKSRSKLKKGSEEYRKSLQDEIKLLKQQKALYDDGIKHPEKLVSLKVTSSTKDPTATGSISTSASSSSLSGNTKYADIISKYASAYGLDPNLVATIIKTESSFNANATSKAGAQGLMQLMPDTAKGLGVSNSYDPEQNIMGGTKYFANLVKKYNGDIELALMAYNGGPGRIDKWLKSGKSISLPTEIKNYAGKVLSAYSGNSGTSTSSKVNLSSSDNVKNTVKGPSASDLAKAAQDAVQNSNSLDQDIYQRTIDYIQDFVTQSEDRISRLSTLISQSQGRQSSFSEGSSLWRKEESSQSYYLQEQQKELENENKQLDKLVKENKITSGEFDKQKAANSEKWWDLEKQIQEKRFNIIQSFFTEYDNKINQIKAQYDDSQARLGLLTEGTKEYNDVLQSQIPLLKQEQKEHQAQIDLINKQINNDKLTAAQKEELINRLHTETAAWLDNESAIKSNIEQLQSLRESAADKIIEDYKSMIEKQRDLELDAFDQRKEAEDKRHEQVKKNLEEENKLFEDVINAQLKALDRQNTSDDYDTELNKKLKERQDLQNKINELSLDDSIEGKAKKKDLQEQLDTKDEEIAKFKLDRERELRKQSLQDQLDDHKKQNDQIADSEDKLNQEINDNIDKEKKAVEQKYKDILENDKLYYELKQGLLSEDSNVVKSTLTELQTGYDTYFGTLKGHVFDTDQEFKNLNFTLEKSLEMLQKYSNGDYSEQNDFPSGYTPPSDINSGTGTDGGSKVTPDAQMAWSNYLSNKLQAETLRNKMATLDKKSQQYKDAENTFNNLSKANANYRSTYKFKDGSYDQLKSLAGADIFSAETGGMTPAWGKGGKLLLAHEKELVLNKTDTSNLLTAVDITRNIVSGLKNLTSLIKPQAQSPSLAGYGNIQMDITIERLTGDENGAKTFFNTIQKNLKKLGK